MRTVASGAAMARSQSHSAVHGSVGMSAHEILPEASNQAATSRPRPPAFHGTSRLMTEARIGRRLPLAVVRAGRLEELDVELEELAA